MLGQGTLIGGIYLSRSERLVLKYLPPRPYFEQSETPSLVHLTFPRKTNAKAASLEEPAPHSSREWNTMRGASTAVSLALAALLSSVVAFRTPLKRHGFLGA
eukprot:scaffold2107_cov222-Pinguiococcus_pyrenoidosus.AAC.8